MVTFGRWLGYELLCYIPGVNIVMLVMWAVDSTPGKRTHTNWAQACFVFFGIVIGVTMVLYALFFIIVALLRS